MAELQGMPSKRLIASYIFDWISIIIIAIIGILFGVSKPNHHPFSLLDLSISYPYIPEHISTAILLLASLVAPGVVIVFVCLIFVPGKAGPVEISSKLKWRRKFWEWHTGWMGLALSVVLAYTITQGLKNLFGKPRPNMLDRCNPDITNINKYSVGNFSEKFNIEWILVDVAICQQTDKSFLNDGFQSFPSEHASISWSGLLYLALFLCSKFAISIPFLPARMATDSPDDFVLPTHKIDSQEAVRISSIAPRDRAAAPPVYLLALPSIPIAVAVYITSTRYFQYYHFGMDIFAGMVIGILSAWFSFHWYHMPISRGAGWSWGPRSRDRAWGIGVGCGAYVGLEGWSTSSLIETHVEGSMVHQTTQTTVEGPAQDLILDTEEDGSMDAQAGDWSMKGGDSANVLPAEGSGSANLSRK